MGGPMSNNSENQRSKSQHSKRLKAFRILSFEFEQYLLKIGLLLSLLLFSHSNAYGADTKTANLLSVYQVKLDKYENFVTSQSANFQTGILASRKGKTLIVAKEYVPQSIVSVKARAKEDGVAIGTVKIMKWKDRALFYYETPTDFHVYSTLGGHLLISKKVQPNFDFSKLSLLKKQNKKVAKL